MKKEMMNEMGDDLYGGDCVGCGRWRWIVIDGSVEDNVTDDLNHDTCLGFYFLILHKYKHKNIYYKFKVDKNKNDELVNKFRYLC